MVQGVDTVAGGGRAVAVSGRIAFAVASGWSIVAASAEPDVPAPPDDSVLETVVVTGTRLGVPTRQSAAPVVALEAADLERRRADSLGDVLLALPVFTGTQQNTNVNNGGDGSTRAALRGLGSGRTLVLLNGRRLPNGGVGGDDSVDFNTLPMSMVERVEIVTSGASSIYGADAVAGAINVITKAPAPGAFARIERSAAAAGDGGVASAQAGAGMSIGGGAWTLGLDYVRQDGVKQGRRGYSATPLSQAAPDGPRFFAGNGNLPDGNVVVPAGNALGLAPGAYTHVGTTGQRTAANYRPVVLPGPDGFNFAPYNYLQTPNERGTAWLLGSQPVGGAELFFEGSWHRRESSQRLAPSPYRTGIGVAPLLANGRPGIPASNWYNPFGVDLRQVQRRAVELNERGFDQRITAWRALVGVRGDAGRWRYEIAGAEARSTSVVDERGLLVGARLAQALGPSGPDATGRIVCGRRDPATGIVPASAIVAGCVPLDLFGGVGSITRAMLDYSSVDLLDTGTNRQRWITASANGPWGRLPAGDVRWAVGVEYRREAADYTFDPLRLQGVAGGTDTPLPGASYRAREAYAEARAPLLSAAAFTGAVEATASVRRASFSSFGSNTTWSAGLHWAPLERLDARAVYARVYRAPSLDELYRGQRLDLASFPASDPCGNGPTPAQRANCAAAGVPGGAYVQNPSLGYEVLSGGNPALQPERGDTLNVGATWRASARTRVSVDAFRIELPGYIESPDEQLLLNECATRGLAATCGRILREPDGSVAQISVIQQNLGTFVTSGVDVAVDTATDLFGGVATLGVRATWLQRLDARFYPGAEPLRAAGRYALGPAPRWRTTADAAWTRGGLRLGYTVQTLGAYRACGVGFLDVTDCVPVSRAYFHDVDAAYTLRSGVRLYAGLRNATDRTPPFIPGSNANTDTGTYAVLGRLWFAGASFDWR
jgi:iron complex outermembrane receptor protein